MCGGRGLVIATRTWALSIAVMLAGCYAGLDGSGRADGASSIASDSAGADAGDGSGSGESGEGDDANDPGRITLHRLNRAEYNNTIRDLFWGLDVSPADNFPADDHSYGFDNIADVL